MQARLLQAAAAAEEAARLAASHKAAAVAELALAESRALAAVSALRVQLDAEAGRNGALEAELEAAAAQVQELEELVGGPWPAGRPGPAWPGVLKLCPHQLAPPPTTTTTTRTTAPSPLPPCRSSTSSGPRNWRGWPDPRRGSCSSTGEQHPIPAQPPCLA
jgi:hypothetical protein